MNVKWKWYLRQTLIGYLSMLVSPTFWGITLCFIRLSKFCHYGTTTQSMHPMLFPPVAQAATHFWNHSISPILVTIPLVLALEILFRTQVKLGE